MTQQYVAQIFEAQILEDVNILNHIEADRVSNSDLSPGRLNLEGEYTEARIGSKGDNNTMEVDVNHDGTYPEEEWPTNEPGGRNTR